LKGRAAVPGQYVVTMTVPVLASQMGAFIAIHAQAAEIYRRLGAEDMEVFRLADGEPKYGCRGISNLVQAQGDEVIVVVRDRFADRERYLRLAPVLDGDPGLALLFDELVKIVDFSRAVRAEFEQALP